MRYPALITKEGTSVLAEFPDCPGCQTFAEPGQNIEREAQEALEGWLEAHLIDGEAPPRPSKRAPRGGVLWVEVSPLLAARLALRWARQDANLTQAELAKKAGVSQQMIAKLEKPGSNPTLGTMQKVAGALEARVEVTIIRISDSGGPAHVVAAQSGSRESHHHVIPVSGTRPASPRALASPPPGSRSAGSPRRPGRRSSSRR